MLAKINASGVGNHREAYHLDSTCCVNGAVGSRLCSKRNVPIGVVITNEMIVGPSNVTTVAIVFRCAYT